MKRLKSLVVVALGLLLSGQVVLAQPSNAGWKIRGEYNYGNNGHNSARSAGRYMQSARDGSQDFYHYSYTAPAIAAPVAKRESEDIAKNAEAAKKELDTLRKAAAADKVILVKLDAIEKHLAAAMEMHTKMHGECCKDHVDGQKTAECCSEMITEFEKAQAEHRGLMRLITPPKPVVTEKPKA